MDICQYICNKLFRKMGHYISSNIPISSTKKRLTVLVFVDDTDIPVHAQEVQRTYRRQKSPGNED